MKIPVGWHPRCRGFVALYHGWLPDLPSVRGIGLVASPFTAMQPRAAGRFSLCSFFDYSVGTCCAGLNMPPLIQRIICCFNPIRGLLIIVRGAFPEGASIRPLILNTGRRDDRQRQSVEKGMDLAVSITCGFNILC